MMKNSSLRNIRENLCCLRLCQPCSDSWSEPILIISQTNDRDFKPKKIIKLHKISLLPMKKTTLFLLTLCSLAAQAQIQAFNNAARNDFYGIGGYSFTKQTFPDGVQVNPYVVSGPLPQNDFSFAASADGGITNRLDYISTTNTNTGISIKLFGNNVRKFGCRVIGINSAMTGSTSDIISLVATTNLGYNVIQTGGGTSGRFVGFNLIENDNDYIVSITASFQTPPSPAAFLTIYDIIVGDNAPQNVALNFDGVDDYVTTNSNVGNFNTLQNFTVECWIKPDPTQTTQSGNNPDENDIISKWAGLNAGVNNKYPFVIRYLNQNRTNVNERGRIRVGKWDGTNFPRITSTIAVNDGQWHHVAFVRDEGLFTLYIDGVANGNGVNATTTTTNGTIIDDAINRVNNTTPLQFGRRGNNESYFKGEIDEVRIWLIGKTATQIADERFCKTPNSNNLHVSYNFSNGVPHDNNVLISQVQDKIQNIGGAEHGTLNNFAKTGDASNFVTGQVKYVRTPINGNGSTWSNAFFDLRSALTANTCNDLFDVYVAKGTAAYKPSITGDVNTSFNIPTGMSIYGGFAGDEKSINQRNLALIHSTNKTTLSGDLNGNDTPFNFTTNRGDNSIFPVKITGNNVVFDGFTVSGGGARAGGAGIGINGTNATIKNSRIIDNANQGLNIFGYNTTIANCSMMGNNSDGIVLNNSSASIKESLIANNGFDGIYITVDGTRQTTITNSTIASNASRGIRVETIGGTSTNTLKNTLIYNNAFGGISTAGGGITNTITYSLVQGITTGTGNLDGNTVNPQFVSPLANNVQSDAGDFRLKWCSRAIGAGDNAGISPLDLDRNPRNFNGTADMGAFEFLGNTPSQVNNSIITGTIDSPTYAGGAIQTITSTAKILAPAGAIDFKAPNSITLNPGFEARGVGQYFKAQIGANVGCSN
jgi:hypothetical protein